MSAAIRLHLLWSPWCHQTGKWVWERKPPEEQTPFWMSNVASFKHLPSFLSGPALKGMPRYTFSCLTLLKQAIYTLIYVIFLMVPWVQNFHSWHLLGIIFPLWSHVATAPGQQNGCKWKGMTNQPEFIRKDWHDDMLSWCFCLSKVSLIPTVCGPVLHIST